MKTVHRAFTLIEMLVVIAIIGILIGLLIPAVAGAIKRARKTAVKAEVMQIDLAWRNYFDDYSIWPADSATLTLSKPLESTSGKTLDRAEINLLTAIATAPNINHKKRTYLEVQPANSNMLDRWGFPYKYLLDLDYDNKVALRWNDDAADTVVTKRVLVWSVGEDGMDTTSEYRTDDVRSW